MKENTENQGKKVDFIPVSEEQSKLQDFAKRGTHDLLEEERKRIRRQMVDAKEEESMDL